MDSSSSSPEDSTASFKEITAAERIQELCEIDRQVTKSLEEAGRAIKALTGVQQQSDENDGQPAPLSLDEAKAAFASHSTAFFHAVQGISARLRRQVYALEEAGIITDTDKPVEPSAPIAAPRAMVPNARGAPMTAQNKVAPPMQITNGGMGNLDIGWLNSRRDEVGKQKEAELWAEARALLSELAGQSDSTADRMQVDETSSNGAAAAANAGNSSYQDGSEDELIIED